MKDYLLKAIAEVVNRANLADVCSGCDSYNTSSLEITCSSHLIEGQAICLQKNDSTAQKCIDTPENPLCGGVLLCSEENLGGVCKVVTESTNDFNDTWYYNETIIGRMHKYVAVKSLPKSAIPVNNNWEIFAPKESRFSSNNTIPSLSTSGTEYSNGNTINFNLTDDASNVFVIQPINKYIFKMFYGSAIPYSEVAYKIGEFTRYREVFKNSSVTLSGNLLSKFGINFIEHDDNIRFGGINKDNSFIDLEDLENISNEILYLDKLIISKIEDDIGEGLVICGEDNLNNYECKSIKRMAWRFIDSTGDIIEKSTNWPIFGDENDDITNVKNLSKTSLLYLHEGWEAFVCNTAYDDLKDCNILTPNYSYYSFTEIGISDPKFLIVQPKTAEKLADVFGDIPYAILYDEPNFNGNHVLVYKDDSSDIKKYPNPIKNPKSVYNNKKGLNLYLNKGGIVEHRNSLNIIDIPLYNEIDDKFINTTDSTPWSIESESIDKYYTISTYTNESFFGIHNDGVKIIFNEVSDDGYKYYKNYNGRYNELIDISKIDELYLYENWEAYFCKDVEKNNCEHYSNEIGNLNNLNLITDLKTKFGTGFNIEYMLIQPINHTTINRFYGHKEYNELGNGLSGYVELYKTTDFTGDREVILNYSDVNTTLINIGVDTIFKANEVKAILVVGGLNVKGNGNIKLTVTTNPGYSSSEVIKTGENFKVNKNSSNMNSYNFDSLSNELLILSHDISLLNYIIIYPTKVPSIITHANLDANAKSLAPFLARRSKNNTIFGFYTNNGSFLNVLSSDKSLYKYWSEEKEQNKIMDNADFVYYAAHGDWTKDEGSAQAILDNSWFYNTNKTSALEEGYQMGDYETEWMITSACNSLGIVKCSSCIKNNVYYDSIDECENIFRTTTSYCISKYRTPEEEVFSIYKNHFANGLHGFGGMYKLSHWIGSYADESDEFWKKIEDGKSMAYSWISSFGSSKWFLERKAGYIAPGPCRKYIKNEEMVYSYVHNDHFWNYGSINGGTQKDPNKAFIVNEGFCYYAYAGYKERPYSFSDIKHDPANWIILDQEDGGFVTDGITSNLLSYFKINEDDVFVGESLISYSKADENNFLTMNFDKDSSIWDVFIDDNLVYSLKNNSDIFYENNIQSIVDTYNYEILNVNLSLIADRHYDYEGNADDEVGVYEVIFTYNLSNNGNPFLEENYVKIGVNPVTGDITSIKTKIMPIGESNEIIDYKLIDNDFNDLVSQNGEIYYKAYYKTNNQYRPAIYKIDTSDIEVVKVY